MSIAVWNTIRLHSSEFHVTDLPARRAVLGDHALVAEPGPGGEPVVGLGLVGGRGHARPRPEGLAATEEETDPEYRVDGDDEPPAG